MSSLDHAPIDEIEAHVFRIPTDQPEADGTLTWDHTTMVVVRLRSGTDEGLGWTYASAAAKTVVDEVLAGILRNRDPTDIPSLQSDMSRACRNIGRTGVAACAISAVDIALWDLKARSLGVSLVDLFGAVNDSVPIYGSGGFTTYSDETTSAQLRTWVDEWDIPRVKIKIGESWGASDARDLHRVSLARTVVGDSVDVFVDANGGYGRKQAIRLGHVMSDAYGVVWFEEPVSSDDLTGLREVKQSCRAEVTAGEYGFTPWYFADMLDACAVDCLQIDVTRCGGYTVWAQVAQLAATHQVQVSGHCAPNLHAHIAAAAPNLRHLEYFHDHHLIETRLFDGALDPAGGSLCPDRSSPGHGMTLRAPTAEQFRVA